MHSSNKITERCRRGFKVFTLAVFILTLFATLLPFSSTQAAKPVDLAALRKTIADPKTTKFSVDNQEWYILQRKTVNGANYALLLQSIGTPTGTARFAGAGSTNDYLKSPFREQLNTIIMWNAPSVRSLAVVSTLGDLASKTVTTEPTTKPALQAGDHDDVFFLPSYADLRVREFKNSDNAPAGHPLRGDALIWGRTKEGTLKVWGYYGDPVNTMNGGLDTVNYTYPASSIPAFVWVDITQAVASHTVTAHFVDTRGQDLAPATTTTVANAGTFTLAVPPIPAYDFWHWRLDSLTGTSSTDKVSIASVTANRDVYLVYDAAQPVLDLSESTQSGATYTVTGDAVPYSTGTYGGGLVPDPNRTLTFPWAANGKTITLIQSGLRSPALAATPKQGTAIFREIIVEDGVEVTLRVQSIDLLGAITVQGTGQLTLRLDTDPTYLGATTTQGSFVRGHIAVADDGPTTATLTVGAEPTLADPAQGRLTVINPDTGAAAIGGTSGLPSGRITITGGSVTAHQTGAGPAAIGAGAGASGATVAITGGWVTADATAGAAIGGGSATTSAAGAGVNVTISGGTVTATSTGAGAGIGAGTVVPDSTHVAITGGTVTATSQGSAGIGGNITAEAPITLELDDAARVWAYSRDASAIGLTEANRGDGFFVNARLDKPLSMTADKEIYVYDVAYAGHAPAERINTVTLPATYPAFAYSTGTTVTRTDKLYAALGHSAALGFDDTHLIDRVADSDKAIPAVNTLTAYDPYGGSAGVLPVKLRDLPVAGEPTAAHIGKYAADLTSVGQALNGATFVAGGFAYSDTAAANGRPHRPTTLAWPGFGATATLPTGPTLTPNTRYYVTTYLTAMTDIWLTANGRLTVESTTTAEFVTLPHIASASVAAGVTGDAQRLTAQFTGGDEALTVTVYYTPGPIDPTDPASWGTLPSVTLPADEFTTAGFGDRVFSGLNGGGYTYLIVIENETGPDTYVVTFANTVPVTISKTVTGLYGDKTRAFPFTATFRDALGGPLVATTFAVTGSPTPTGGTVTTNAVGEVYFALAHGQSVTIQDTYAGGSVTVVEQPTGGYEATARNGVTGEVTRDGRLTVDWVGCQTAHSLEFTNARGAIVETGVADTWALGGLGGFGLIVVLINAVAAGAGLKRRWSR
ncbi:MAG: hypothetical protein LBI33_08660 [Propionibacteriaceae bacterium]|jgi:hypothetical protein|nr:hypothetical protein [Propionibacteriaceae bacterium]